MKGNKYMKVLKIEDKKCYFSTDGLNYTSIVDISKEDIYLILDIIYNDDGTIIDEVDEDTEIEMKLFNGNLGSNDLTDLFNALTQ